MTQVCTSYCKRLQITIKICKLTTYSTNIGFIYRKANERTPNLRLDFRRTHANQAHDVFSWNSWGVLKRQSVPIHQEKHVWQVVCRGESRLLFPAVTDVVCQNSSQCRYGMFPLCIMFQFFFIPFHEIVMKHDMAIYLFQCHAATFDGA